MLRLSLGLVTVFAFSVIIFSTFSFLPGDFATEILGQSAVEHWQNQHGFDRKNMLEHIAWSQFSRTEYQDGTAWKCAFKYQVEQ